jgi:ornithine cyclodeaminase
MAIPILTDADVDRLADMGLLVGAIQETLRAKAAGRLIAPPRHHVAFGDQGDLVFTIGGQQGTTAIAGFRVYDTFAGDIGERPQITAVWNSRTGVLEGLVVGERLGPLRTGAIGGAAIDTLAVPDAREVAVIGSGVQAGTQLAAACAVRPIAMARVFSRDAGRRSAFAAAMEARLGIAVRPVASARDAVTDAAIVLCATTSPSPVLSADWLAPGAHVNTIGPKLKDAHEMGLDVAARAASIVTDSLAQVAAYPSFFLDGTDHRARLADLALVVAGLHPGRRSAEDVTLFCSAGLAGTEVAVAHALLRGT